ncbi:class I SAM-dependent methyltransferase [Chloroflexota bacterium]
MRNGQARFQKQKDRIRKRLPKYTRKAFRMLPQLDKPRILDVGCGSGVPAMELARLCNGEITGLDINEGLLNILRRKIEKTRSSERVRAVKASILNMEFPDGSFDIIWSEGSIFAIGFERGLREWKRFLKPNGFIVVHDEKGNIEDKLKQISGCGYELVGYFVLTEDVWWAEYFTPLEELINESRIKHADDPQVLEELQNAQRELDMFQKNPQLNSSVFLTIKKC